ncbi:MAG: hypothetical protein IKU02_06755 [Bacteroidaceae bacterium]|nr:hypothetical protein [Bacteroidaceae bacterium]
MGTHRHERTKTSWVNDSFTQVRDEKDKAEALIQGVSQKESNRHQREHPPNSGDCLWRMQSLSHQVISH